MKEKESLSREEAEAIVQAGTHAEAIAHLYELVTQLGGTPLVDMKYYDILKGDLDKVKGDLANVQSQVNDLQLQESGARSRLSKVEAMVEGAVANAIRPLVKEFTAAVKEERRFLIGGLRRLLEGEDIE